MSDVWDSHVNGYVVILINHLEMSKLGNFQTKWDQRRVMQNPNEDTEWNDVLRAKGIIPEKPKEAEVTEEQLLAMVEQTIKEKSGSKCTVSVGSQQK